MIADQIEGITEAAEQEKKPDAAFLVSYHMVDDILRTGGGTEDSKIRIYAKYAEETPAEGMPEPAEDDLILQYSEGVPLEVVNDPAQTDRPADLHAMADGTGGLATGGISVRTILAIVSAGLALTLILLGANLVRRNRKRD